MMQQLELLGTKIVSELAQELFDRPVMSNLMRPAFVERLVMHALGPSWRHVGADWSGWDLEDSRGARVEVKQSAARQTRTDLSSRVGCPTTPVFDIAARSGYFANQGSRWVEGRCRPADLYIFAWHPVFAVELVDHRDPNQWCFYVVLESALPSSRKTLRLPWLQRSARPLTFAELGTHVAKLLSIDGGLKVFSEAVPSHATASRGPADVQLVSR